MNHERLGVMDMRGVLSGSTLGATPAQFSSGLKIM